MYEIPAQEVTQTFRECWATAGAHLQAIAQEGKLSWLKSDLEGPLLEHLSFRLQNQLFFIRITAPKDDLEIPGNLDAVINLAEECNGHACTLPMQITSSGWQPIQPGWGLVDAISGEAIHPPALVSNELIEMSDRELHDFGVQVVSSHIQNELKHRLMSSQSNPAVQPSLWFVGVSGPEWVIVRTVRYPELEACLPDNVDAIRQGCQKLSSRGNFASVSVANADDRFTKEGSNALPLWRGGGMIIRFKGLQEI